MPPEFETPDDGEWAKAVAARESAAGGVLSVRDVLSMLQEARETGEVTVPELGDLSQDAVFYQQPSIEQIATVTAAGEMTDRY